MQALPGLNIPDENDTYTQIFINLNDDPNRPLSQLLKQELWESMEQFEMRSRYTYFINLLKYPFANLANLDKVLLGLLAMKKMRYGIVYDQEMEENIAAVNERMKDLLSKNHIDDLIEQVQEDEIVVELEDTR